MAAASMLHTDGFVKVLADKKTDRVLGVHIVGFGAGEMIHRRRCSWSSAARQILPAPAAHPTCPKP